MFESLLLQLSDISKSKFKYEIVFLTFSDLQEDLAAIQTNPSRAQFCSQRLLCRTLAGNNVYILTITAPASQEDMKRKAVIVLSARVHPGETPSSWIMRGILHFLTGDSDVSTRLRDNFIFKIVQVCVSMTWLVHGYVPL